MDDDYYGSPEKLPPLPLGANVTNGSRANATFVILARNSDLEGTIRAVRSIEDRFNRDYRYPYVFLNDEPFSDDFKRFVQSPLLLIFLFSLTTQMAWQSSVDSQRGYDGVWVGAARTLASTGLDR